MPRLRSVVPLTGVHIEPDADGRGGCTVYVDGVPSSHLDPADPTRLDFEYMRWMGDLLDVLPEPGQPLRAAHLGGAGCTLAGYLSATRPGSTQVVFELRPDVMDAVRAAFGLRSSRRLRLRVGDGRAGLGALPAASQDVVLRDAFTGSEVPAALQTAEFLDQVRRVLAPGGVYLANLADSPVLALARREAATALSRFTRVLLIGEPAQFRGRRTGNLVLAACDDPLPEAALQRRLSSGAVRARLLVTDQVRGFAAGAAPLADPPG